VIDGRTITRIEVVCSLEALREDWTRLARENKNVFSTWEWASTWWRHWGKPPLHIAVCRDRDELVALLPLYLWSRGPLRIARFVGHGPADQLGPICAPGARAVAADALWSTLAREELNVILAELLPGGDGWTELLGRRPMLVEASPTISLAGGWDTYLTERSANLRQQIRRRERQLHRRHSVRFRLAAEPDRLQEDLTLLIQLHRARWGADSAFLRFESFHRDFAAIALQRGWLRLWFLELDNRPAAAWYGLRFADIESYYQAGRDPNFAAESVGFVLLAHSIRAAADDGMREYRLLRGAESFKLRFAQSDPRLQTFALPRGLAGRGAGLAVAAGIRSGMARSTLKRFVRGGTG
jgi:CelD/BcsL family acetyltransferase involved in cellulose biosynthesis